MWRHPYPRCSLLDQQANGRGEKVHFHTLRLLGNVYTKKPKYFLAPTKDEIEIMLVQVNDDGFHCLQVLLY